MLWWLSFLVFVLLMLVLDLGIFNRHAHVIKIKEALLWSAVWVLLALLFTVGIYFGWIGGFAPEQRYPLALQFITAYFIEKSLSIDNIFVFALIFKYFSTKPEHQHKVLFWGIVGAFIMRAIFIFAGVALINTFHWLLYIFGGVLVISGIKMITHSNEEIHPESNPLISLMHKLIPTAKEYHGEQFFVRKNAKLYATPLFAVVVVIEWSDLVFAVDSIPAVLAISTNTFIVYTSNVFAILGLRALYFALGGMLKAFEHLHYGLSAVLIFIGIKMLCMDVYKIPTGTSLSVVAICVLSSILASIFTQRRGAASCGRT